MESEGEFSKGRRGFKEQEPAWPRSSLTEAGWGGGATCVAQPFLQQRLEFAHVLETEVERLESGDGGLAEIVAVQLPHGEAHVPLQKRTHPP